MREKILYAGNFKLPDKNAAAQRVLANAKIFANSGYSVVLVGVTDEINTGIIRHNDVLDNIQMLSVPYPKSTLDWIRFYISNKNINSIINDHSGLKYFIGYNYQSLSFIKLYLKYNRNLKFLADVTEWYQPDDKSLLMRVVKYIDSTVRMRIINKYFTSGNIVISSYLENYYKNSNTLKLPPLVDLEDVKWNSLSEISSKKLKFIFFGTVGGKKEEIGLVLKFFNVIEEKNENCELNIFGITEGELSTIVNFSNSKVKAHGRVSHTVALIEAKKSHYSIFFRENNLVTTAGFPTKFVESMSAGTPVITNYTSDLKDYIRDGQNGFVINIEMLNSNNFKEIESLDFESEKIDSMKAEAFKTAKDNFDFKNYLEKMGKFLKKV